MNSCEWCGQRIVTLRADAKYCSGAHRVAAHRLQKRSGGIPARLVRQNRWVRYSPSKAPLHSVTGMPASSTDPDTWTDWATASKSRRGVGMGFVLGEGIGCIDLDHCLVNGEPTEQAQDLLDQHPNSYVEVSPSGKGLHIWGLREEQPGTRRIVDGLNIETYSAGRYITVTGEVFRQGNLESL